MCERGGKGGEKRGDMRGEGRDDSRDRVQRMGRQKKSMKDWGVMVVRGYGDVRA